MNRIGQYFSNFFAAFGSGWNRFWFTPADPRPLAILRIGAGLVALYYHFSHTADLIRWFGPHGLLTRDTVEKLTTGDGAEVVYYPSYLYLTDVPELLWSLHALGFVALAAMTVGLFTRVSTVLALAVVLSYVHRAPMITGQLEPILTMLLCYLCLGPAGRFLSVDRLLGFGHKRQGPGAIAAPSDESWMANLSLRLIQVHLAGFYLMMGLTKLAGVTWWDGTAAWWLIAHADSRIVDLTLLHQFPYLLNIATHAIVLFELSFGLLIWNRLARPLLLLLAAPMWLMLAAISGQLAFCAVMLVANLAFVPGDFWREIAYPRNPS